MPIRTGDRPLIVTALLGDESFAWLDALRRRHFPSALNRVPAHISLFHKLPGDCVDAVVAQATLACQGQTPLDLASLGVRFLGRGVAISFDGDGLQPIHAALARHWADWLTPQDRQPFKPHVTIQNKVAPPEARALFASMAAQAFPVCRVEGLAIWRYLDGPWRAVTTCRFGAPRVPS